jgi:type IX secretion system substrate protein
MNKIIYPLLIFVSVKSSLLFAQDEQLVPLTNNPVLINEWKRINSGSVSQSEKIQSAANDTLLLPFIDDFSAQWMFPRADLWSDSTVFINADFPINPPTIGVATFDGLNKFGNAYNNINPNAAGWCDALTSKPINTFDDGAGNPYIPSQGLFFSFFYEQKGLGERPETNADYLRLQFLDSSGNWDDIHTILAVAAGPADNTFTRVQIVITDGSYFYKGFRFRFRNNGSQTGNLDHWHIDYVMLRPPPNITNINDVAYVTPGQSLLNGLTAMPYTHYKNGVITPAVLMRNSLTCTMFNNNNTLDKICRFVDKVYDPAGLEIFCNGCPQGSNNFQVNHQSSLSYNFPFSSFEYPTGLTQSTAAFDVVNNIESTSGGPLDDNAQNDTIHYLQKFYNYYAHDDGTAEAGYNLNAAGAQLAYKFHVNKTDALHAVQFYFTQIGTSVANELFKIVVWSNAGGVPGTILYQKINQVPMYSNIIDGYVTYNVNPPQTLSAGDYFFGFIQNNNAQLNLGFDANIVTPSSEKYYNTNGTWTQSNFAGSWMIRPVFTPYPFNVGENEIAPVNILSVYPNPASSILNIDYDTQGKKFQYELTDASGRIVISARLHERLIDVSKLMNGFYVLRVFDDEKKNIFQEKVIIHH